MVTGSIMEKRTITQNIFGRVFSKLRKIELTDYGIIITDKRSNVTTLTYSKLYDIPILTSGLLGSKILFIYENKKYSLSFLNENEAYEAFDLIEENAILNLTEAIKKAGGYFKRNAINMYLRDSLVDSIEVYNGSILSNYKKSKSQWDSKLDRETIRHLHKWNVYFPLSDGKEILREQYETKRLLDRKSFFDVIESNPLTEQQRLSVIRNNDFNLVLAAAGTGKTSVMVAKALDPISGSILT